MKRIMKLLVVTALMVALMCASAAPASAKWWWPKNVDKAGGTICKLEGETEGIDRDGKCGYRSGLA